MPSLNVPAQAFVAVHVKVAKRSMEYNQGVLPSAEDCVMDWQRQQVDKRQLCGGA